MSIGLVVEEPSCEKFVKRIADQLEISLDIVVSHGRGNLNRKLDDYISLHAELPKVIVLVDSHCTPNPDQIAREFVPSAGSHANVHVCVVVHALESWLLADSATLSRKFRVRRIRTPLNPESMCKPEEKLKQIFRQHGGIYRNTRDPEILAKTNDLDIVRQRCRSFDRFLNLLDDC